MPGAARFFAIWVKNDAAMPWEVRPDLDPGSFAQEDAELRKAGLRPGCISGYKGDDGKTRLAAVWFPKTAGVNTARVDLTAKEFDDLRVSNRRQGYRLSWLDVYGNGRDRRYAAIWVNDGQKIEWEDAHGDLQTVDDKGRSLEGYNLLIDCYFAGDNGEPAAPDCGPNRAAVSGGSAIMGSCTRS